MAISTCAHLRHDVFIDFLLRFRPVDGNLLIPQQNVSRNEFTSCDGGRAMTLKLDESEAAILGLVRDTRVDNGVDHAVYNRLDLFQYFLQTFRGVKDNIHYTTFPVASP